jgi:alginate O-acetyltransferase complex protein AlgI
MPANLRLAAALGATAAAVVLAERLTANAHPLMRMMAIVGTLFVGMKILVVAATAVRFSASQWFAFLFSFGMRPAVFTRRDAARAAQSTLREGLLGVTGGALLLAIARLIGIQGHRVIASIVAMIALSLILHFGIIDLLAGMWRRQGYACEPTFREPLRSKSLTEFWSRRWNVGFSEMVAVLVQRPLRNRLGGSVAIFAAFLVSGFLHELAISVPVRAGFGLPTVYFALHGGLVALERKWQRTPGRVWTLSWLALPAPLVFHPPFVRGIVWPLIGLG